MKWLKTYTEIQFNQLENYIKTLEKSLKNESKNFEEWILGEEKQLSEFQKEEFFDFYSEQHQELSELFPNQLRLSFFIICYSTFEQSINAISKNIEKSHKIKVSDLHGRGVIRAKNYLEKVADFDFSKHKALWEKIKDYNKIRNFIVHNYYGIGKSEEIENVSPLLKRYETIKVDSSSEIQISETFCHEVIKDFKLFLDSLFNSTSSK
ncbi:MAG: hypothetical protein AAB373_00505 [Patescibacteria group bacterium]